jgi:hypothetical protein
MAIADHVKGEYIKPMPLNSISSWTMVRGRSASTSREHDLYLHLHFERFAALTNSLGGVKGFDNNKIEAALAARNKKDTPHTEWWGVMCCGVVGSHCHVWQDDTIAVAVLVGEKQWDVMQHRLPEGTWKRVSIPSKHAWPKVFPMMQRNSMVPLHVPRVKGRPDAYERVGHTVVMRLPVKR